MYFVVLFLLFLYFYSNDLAGCFKCCYSGDMGVLQRDNNTFKKVTNTEIDKTTISERKLLDKNVRKLFVNSIFTKREEVLKNRLDEEILGAIQSKSRDKKRIGMSVGDSFEILIREDIDGKVKTHIDFKMVIRKVSAEDLFIKYKKVCSILHK